MNIVVGVGRAGRSYWRWCFPAACVVAVGVDRVESTLVNVAPIGLHFW